MNAPHFIHLLWYALIAIWFAAGLLTKRTVRRQRSSSRWLQTVISAAGLLLLFSQHVRFGILGWRLIPSSAAAGWMGAGIAVAGCLLALWARVTLGRNWSGDVTLKQDHALITSGPYRWARHPIYTGFLLMVLGTAIVSGFVASFTGLALIFIAIWMKFCVEESFMQQQFGQQYVAYKQRVKALIPGIL